MKRLSDAITKAFSATESLCACVEQFFFDAIFAAVRGSRSGPTLIRPALSMSVPVLLVLSLILWESGLLSDFRSMCATFLTWSFFRNASWCPLHRPLAQHVTSIPLFSAPHHSQSSHMCLPRWSGQEAPVCNFFLQRDCMCGAHGISVLLYCSTWFSHDCARTNQ